jgi:uncharacterized protein (DUF433 family)
MHNKLIDSQPNIMMGKPVIAGTRITVESILDQLLDAHPRLTTPAVLAAFAFAAEALRADVVYPLPMQPEKQYEPAGG